MTNRKRRRRRTLTVERCENRMVLSGLGLAGGMELPADATVEASDVCIATYAKAKGKGAKVVDAPSKDSVSKPFKVTGAGFVDKFPLIPGEEVPFTAVGNATNLGKYTGEGTVRLDAFTSPTTADFSSGVPFVFTGANGDQLAFDFAGSVELTFIPNTDLVTTKWTAEFTPVIGENSGKFANVSGGSFEMIAETGPVLLTDVNIPFSWNGEGELDYAKSLPYRASGTPVALLTNGTVRLARGFASIR